MCFHFIHGFHPCLHSESAFCEIMETFQEETLLRHPKSNDIFLVLKRLIRDRGWISAVDSCVERITLLCSLRAFTNHKTGGKLSSRLKQHMLEQDIYGWQRSAQYIKLTFHEKVFASALARFTPQRQKKTFLCSGWWPLSLYRYRSETPPPGRQSPAPSRWICGLYPWNLGP